MAVFDKNIAAIAKARTTDKKANAATSTSRIKLLQDDPALSATKLTTKLAAKVKAEKLAKDKLQASVNALYAENSPQNLVINWDATVPVLLLPLRLETKFMIVNDKMELWLRIYPDDIAVQQHEPLLSAKEFEAGKQYWGNFFDADKSGGGLEIKKAGWEQLRNSFGANRAAWIAKQSVATNWNSRNTLSKKEELVFPALALKPAEWTQAPKTEILPDKFVVTIFKNDVKVVEQEGNLLPDTLMLGHDPFGGGAAFTKTADGIEFAKEFSWMADFEEAIRIGMGFKIQCKQEYSVDPTRFLLDRIVVLGVSLSADAKKSAEVLGGLMENHRYTEGLAILPQGTPTNNTEDAVAGFVANEDPQQSGFYDVSTTAPFNKDPLCDAARLSFSLGIDPGIVAGIANDSVRDHADAVTMNHVLFPGTIGYYLDTLLDKYVPDQYIGLMRDFFENNITGAGPLPSIRVGDQPYGLLVTSDFSRWKTTATDPSQVAMLDKLYQLLDFFSAEWELQSKKVLYVGRTMDSNNKPLTPDDVFLDVVGLEPASISFERRTGFLNDLPLLQASSPELLRFNQEATANQTTIANQLNTFSTAVPPAQLFLTNLLFRPENRVHIPGKNLIDGLPVDEKRPLKNVPVTDKNYLTWLKEVASMDALEKQDFSGANAPNFLLYLLARHALLLELRQAALAIMNKKEGVIERNVFDKTYMNLKGTTATDRDLTIWEILKADLTKIGTTSTDPAIRKLGDQLLNQKSGSIQSLKAGIAALSALPTAKLERLLTGHLDCLTYRLDAWQTGLFYEKLNSRRKDAAAPVTGIYLGAFGYLENLVPDFKTALTPDQVPTALQPPVGTNIYRANNNAGLMQAPSLDHAAAAALLMTGYRNNATHNDAGAFSVNISSARVRKAVELLEGVRNGQSVEALLGYQFERRCHEQTLQGENLNRFILLLRERFPIKNQYNQQEGEAETADIFRKVQPNVVNGLAVVKERSFDVFLNMLVNALASNNAGLHASMLLSIAEELDDTLDAVKDLLLSEAVFQAASGNTARTGAVLESLRDGSVPPDPAILKTPRRSRFAFNHVLAVHFRQVAMVASPWINIALSPAAVFEPGLNVWLSGIFGNPANILCTAVHQGQTPTPVIQPTTISLADLGLQPIDFLLYAGKDTGNANTQLEQRISHRYRTLIGLPATQQIAIDFSPMIVKSKRTFGVMISLAKALFTVFGKSRAIHAGDYLPFVQGQSNEQDGIDLDELRGRVDALIAATEAVVKKLEAIVPNDAPKNEANPATLGLLFKQWETLQFADNRFLNFELTADKLASIVQVRTEIAAFDVPAAWPLEIPSNLDSGIENFLASTAKLWRNVLLQIANARSILTASAAENNATAASMLTKLAKLLLGAAFPAMPKFRYQNATDIKLAFKDKKQLLKYYSGVSALPDTIVPDDWFQGVSEVRSKAGSWELARSLSEIYATTDLSISPVQLPYRKQDSWLAVQFPATDSSGQPFSISTDTISCSVFGPDAFNTEALQSGLLIDEWSETIPVDSETTGIAFNYNQPDSMPPQALLLAVYPGIEKNWNWDALLGTVTDTFKRAKMRAVEPRHFANNQLMQHFLPGIIAPVNISGNNISLDFAVASDEFLKKIPPGVELYQAHTLTATTT